MKTPTKKTMAKAALRKPNGADPRATKQDLRRRIQEQRDIAALTRQLKRATDRADEHLADLSAALMLRED
jgi:hypothetical protein